MISVYQAIESAQIGFECESHRGHHLNIDLCPIRIVDADGRQLPPGESGEVVISNLINRATVLLNYRLGDIAAEIPDPCDCGRSLPLLSMVEGRAHEWLTASDGRRLHSQILIRPFSLDTEVWGYRITQSKPGEFRAEVLAVPGSDREQVAGRIRERFAEIVGPGRTSRSPSSTRFRGRRPGRCCAWAWSARGTEATRRAQQPRRGPPDRDPDRAQADAADRAQGSISVGGAHLAHPQPVLRPDQAQDRARPHLAEEPLVARPGGGGESPLPGFRAVWESWM